MDSIAKQYGKGEKLEKQKTRGCFVITTYNYYQRQKYNSFKYSRILHSRGSFVFGTYILQAALGI